MGTKSKTNGHVQRSTSEWQTIMKRFSQSGRSRAAFCRAEGISPSTFDVWHRKLRQVKAPATKPPAEFVELTPVEATAIGGWAIETELPDGTVARFWGFRMLLMRHVERILAYRDPVDMRKQFDGLIAIVRNVLGHSSGQNSEARSPADAERR